MTSRKLGPALALALALASSTALADPTPAKKALIDKLIQLQQQAISESFANTVLQGPLPQLMQAGRVALQQVPAEKREATAKAMEADVKKFVEENSTYLKDKAAKAVPNTAMALYDERFSEDELRQVLAWIESPVSKKLGVASLELQKAVGTKVMEEVGPTLDGRLKALQASLAKHLGLPAPGSAPGTTPKAPASGTKK